MATETAIRIEVLPARLGDCLLVECPRVRRRPWRMLIDGGPADTWPVLKSRLERMRPADQHFDVVVITHIDSDHIGGMIPLLRSGFAHNVDDFWFNGRTHLPDGKTRSVAQGDSVVAELLGETDGVVLPWNVAFGGGPIDTGPEGGFLEVPYQGGPKVTVLSPTTKRLKALAEQWFAAVEAVKRGLREEREPDVLEPLGDLQAIAAQETPEDSSVTNGSSIALLIEHRGASVVLGADAFGSVLGAGLAGVAGARGRGPARRRRCQAAPSWQ